MSQTIHIAKWAPDVADLARELADHGLPADAVDVYVGRNRVVKTERKGRLINIKAFKIPHIVNRLVYGNLRGSKARRSFEHALRLRNLGFNTPEPLGYVELRHGPLFGRSYYLSQHIEGFREMRSFGAEERLGELAEQLGALIARLHDAGIWVKDFSRGNLLRRRDDKGRYTFFLVDINRMEFGVDDRKKLMQNFKDITSDHQFLRRLAKAYARHARLDEQATVDEVMAIRVAFEQSWAKRQRFKRLLGRKK